MLARGRGHCKTVVNEKNLEVVSRLTGFCNSSLLMWLSGWYVLFSRLNQIWWHSFCQLCKCAWMWRSVSSFMLLRLRCTVFYKTGKEQSFCKGRRLVPHSWSSPVSTRVYNLTVVVHSFWVTEVSQDVLSGFQFSKIPAARQKSASGFRAFLCSKTLDVGISCWE